MAKPVTSTRCKLDAYVIGEWATERRTIGSCLLPIEDVEQWAREMTGDDLLHVGIEATLYVEKGTHFYDVIQAVDEHLGRVTIGGGP